MAPKGRGSKKLPTGNTRRSDAPYFALSFQAEDGAIATAYRHALDAEDARDKAEDILAGIEEARHFENTTEKALAAGQIMPDGIPGDWGWGQAGKARITGITRLTEKGSLTKRELKALGLGAGTK